MVTKQSIRLFHPFKSWMQLQSNGTDYALTQLCDLIEQTSLHCLISQQDILLCAFRRWNVKMLIRNKTGIFRWKKPSSISAAPGRSQSVMSRYSIMDNNHIHGLWNICFINKVLLLNVLTHWSRLQKTPRRASVSPSNNGPSLIPSFSKTASLFCEFWLDLLDHIQISLITNTQASRVQKEWGTVMPVLVRATSGDHCDFLDIIGELPEGHHAVQQKIIMLGYAKAIESFCALRFFPL